MSKIIFHVFFHEAQYERKILAAHAYNERSDQPAHSHIIALRCFFFFFFFFLFLFLFFFKRSILIFFLFFLLESICCVYSLEAPHRLDEALLMGTRKICFHEKKKNYFLDTPSYL